MMLQPMAVEVASPALETHDGQTTVTSLQIAEHFGKRHGDVIRAIRKLEVPETFGRRNFASSSYRNEQGKEQPMYHVTRDGFALLAMGFTGKEAMRWKLAYIAAFNAMEAHLKSLYVEPLVNEKQFRMGIPMHLKFKLQEQSRRTMRELLAETAPAARRNLYWQLCQINEALGIPTESAEQLLGMDAPALPAQRNGAPRYEIGFVDASGQCLPL